MGIDKRYQIIKSQERETQNLTNRTFLYSFFLNVEFIYQSKVAFDVLGHSSITVVLMSVHFLFTGDDLHELVPEISEKERKLNAAKRDAVILYIGEKVQALKIRREEVEKKLAECEDTDVNRKIEDTLAVIADLEKQIGEATVASREIVLEICDLSAKLEEANF